MLKNKLTATWRETAAVRLSIDLEQTAAVCLSIHLEQTAAVCLSIALDQTAAVCLSIDLEQTAAVCLSIALDLRFSNIFTGVTTKWNVSISVHHQHLLYLNKNAETGNTGWQVEWVT